ncbi:hypothetical protein GIB67_009902 [Kingdonia uniflora]|uniref:Late embryogenesis abundant protein LEA-2 subgroup domain-containing protein n=1 Tax=Kingdonia uniflora TaxID=39325 RepID=A0A7J7L479_9MAGN|nr:hypothetical protein GIB67_009902 [Kingdonia uniflora]
MPSTRRPLKIYCGISAIFFIIILVILIVIFLTLLRPKQPGVTANSITLKHFDAEVFPAFGLNVTLALVLTINNHRNYGSFKYDNTTAYLSYHGEVIAEAPLEGDLIPARSKHNISTTVDIGVDKLVESPYFLNESSQGVLNFTSVTTLRGIVRVFKVFHLHAVAHSTCEVALFLKLETVDSICTSKLKL